MVLILDFGFGESCLTVVTPVDGFLAFVDVTLGDKLTKLSGNGRLIVITHGEVGVLPEAKNAQPLELLPLDIEELLCKLSAPLPDLENGHGLPLTPQFLVYLVFDRKPVTVPSRNIVTVIADHEP